jgi:hypothetical protein
VGADGLVTPARRGGGERSAADTPHHARPLRDCRKARVLARKLARELARVVAVDEARRAPDPAPVMGAKAQAGAAVAEIGVEQGRVGKVDQEAHRRRRAAGVDYGPHLVVRRAAAASRSPRTLRARPSGVNGFWMNGASGATRWRS